MSIHVSESLKNWLAMRRRLLHVRSQDFKRNLLEGHRHPGGVINAGHDLIELPQVRQGHPAGEVMQAIGTGFLAEVVVSIESTPSCRQALALAAMPNRLPKPRLRKSL